MLRQPWRQALPKLDAPRLVFMDESGATTNRTRLRGRVRKGIRWLAQAPHGHWGSPTLEVAGPSDETVFRAYVGQVLVPSLEPGEVVIMDHLQTHDAGEALRRITACGASVQFLPPYRPAFNPIEKMWRKAKNLLRGLAARTQPELSQAITQAFQAITPANARGWFFSCGITAALP